MRSAGARSINRGQTFPFSIPRLRAPASKVTQGEATFSRVRHTMPKVETSRAELNSAPHRDPLSMLSEEMNGSTDWRTEGIHSRRRVAIDLLRSPDQLRKILTETNDSVDSAPGLRLDSGHEKLPGDGQMAARWRT